MNKKLKKGLTISSAAAMGMSIVLPTVSVIAAPAVANGWVPANGTWYYYNNGTMVKNGWAKDSKGWCFLNAVDGSWVQNGWAKDSTGWGYIQNGYWVEHEMWAQDAAGWNHIKANGYWDGAAAVATNPTATVATASSIKLTENATNIPLGTAKELTATVKKLVNGAEVAAAGLEVTFVIDSPLGNVNEDKILKAVTDANGVAKVSYSRVNPGTDTISAYPTDVPTVRNQATIAWGVNTVLAVDNLDSVVLRDNQTRQYKITLKNPNNGLALSNSLVNITFAENIDSDTTNDTTASINGVVPGQTSNAQTEVQVTTNSDGEATFVVTGAATTATPIVFVDENLATGLAGDNDQRLDSNEIQVTTGKVKFQGNQASFTLTPVDASTTVSLGGQKIYTIEAKDQYGNAFTGNVDLSFAEITDSSSSTTTAAQIAWIDNDSNLRTTFTAAGANGTTVVGAARTQITLNSSGKATFAVSDATNNNVGTPVVWQDIDTGNDNIRQSDEPQATAAAVTFKTSELTQATLEADRATQPASAIGAGLANNASAGEQLYTFIYKDQSARAINLVAAGRVTYTFENTGSKNIFITDNAGFTAGTFSVNGAANAGFATQTVAPGTSITIAATIPAGANTVSFEVDAEDATSLKVSAVGVGDGKTVSATATSSWVAPRIVGAGETVTGKVIAFETTDGTYAGAASSGFVVIELDGQPGTYAWSPYSKDSVASVADLFAVGSSLTALNTADADTFEKALTIGETVQIVDAGGFAAGVADTFNLVNADGSKVDSQFKDTTLPQVATVLGAGAPVTINAGATNTITFSEALNATGRAAVEASLTALSANDGTYAWNANNTVITITGAVGNTVYTGADATAVLTDTNGNASAAVVIVDAN